MMSEKILTTSTSSLKDFCQNPITVLQSSEQGTVAVFDNNKPVFYVITSNRLANLLALETGLNSLNVNMISKNCDYLDNTTPTGKFPMYSKWQPDKDFLRTAALWGIVFKEPVTPEELASFSTYWQAEGKVFHHIQWQQKLARSVQMSRSAKNNRRDINTISQPENHIPKGFRG